MPTVGAFCKAAASEASGVAVVEPPPRPPAPPRAAGRRRGQIPGCDQLITLNIGRPGRQINSHGLSRTADILTDCRIADTFRVLRSQRKTGEHERHEYTGYRNPHC